MPRPPPLHHGNLFSSTMQPIHLSSFHEFYLQAKSFYCSACAKENIAFRSKVVSYLKADMICQRCKNWKLILRTRYLLGEQS